MKPRTVSSLRDMLRRSPGDAVKHFLGETVWQWDVDRHARPARLGIYLLRLIYLVGRGFVSARAQTHAMALTYTTMLALVPTFAIMVAIFSSIRGLEEVRGRLETFMFDAIAASPTTERVLSEKLNELVSNLQDSRGVAGVAFFVFLFLTIVTLLSTLEKTLNDIWGVKRPRSFVQKFITYWCIATLGPLLLGGALVQGSSLWYRLTDWTSWGTTRLLETTHVAPRKVVPPPQATSEDAFGLPGVTGALFDELASSNRPAEPSADAPTAGSNLQTVLTGTVQTGDAPAGSSFPAFVLTVVTFTMLYWLLPNTKVRWRAAGAGALCTTTLWTLTKWLLATSSSMLVKYDTVYGSMATIPITMFWLYLSWLIVILGAELTFALQNLKMQRKEELAVQTNELCRELVTLRLVTAVAHAYEHGGRPPSKDVLAERTGAPHVLVSQLLFHLCEDGLLRDVEVEDDRGYVPGRPLDRISLSDIIDSLRERHGIAFDLAWGDDLPILSQHLGQANAASKALAGRVTLRMIVDALEEKAKQTRPGDAVTPDAAAVSVLAARAIATASGITTIPLHSKLRRSGELPQPTIAPAAIALPPIEPTPPLPAMPTALAATPNVAITPAPTPSSPTAERVEVAVTAPSHAQAVEVAAETQAVLRAVASITRSPPQDAHAATAVSTGELPAVVEAKVESKIPA